MHKTIAAVGAILAAVAVTTLSGCGRSAEAGPRPQTEVALKIRKGLEAGAAAEGGHMWARSPHVNRA